MCLASPGQGAVENVSCPPGAGPKLLCLSILIDLRLTPRSPVGACDPISQPVGCRRQAAAGQPALCHLGRMAEPRGGPGWGAGLLCRCPQPSSGTQIWGSLETAGPAPHQPTEGLASGGAGRSRGGTGRGKEQPSRGPTSITHVGDHLPVTWMNWLPGGSVGLGEGERPEPRRVIHPLAILRRFQLRCLGSPASELTGLTGPPPVGDTGQLP